jgi:hypothetical protein
MRQASAEAVLATRSVIIIAGLIAPVVVGNAGCCGGSEARIGAHGNVSYATNHLINTLGTAIAPNAPTITAGANARLSPCPRGAPMPSLAETALLREALARAADISGERETT